MVVVAVINTCIGRNVQIMHDALAKTGCFIRIGKIDTAIQFYITAYIDEPILFFANRLTDTPCSL